jgi:hypothetical protein
MRRYRALAQIQPFRGENRQYFDVLSRRHIDGMG